MRPLLFHGRPNEWNLKMDKDATIALELTKIVASKNSSSSGADLFKVSTDYLSVYRYILKDLTENS